MPDNAKDSWWTDARKILAGQALTLLLTPASVAVTYYLTERYKAPRPDLQYVSADALKVVTEPSPTFRNRINSESHLAWGFRDEVRKASLALQDPQVCVSWLDGGAWDSDCIRLYRSVTNQMIGMVRVTIDQLRRGGSTQGSISDPLGSRQLGEAERGLRIAEDFARELTRLDSTESSRSGDVRFAVGVLNRGASDGTVFSEASLTFGHETFHVYAQDYVTIQAHSFKEVTFESARADDGHVSGTWARGEEDVITSWSKTVKKGQEIPFTLTITLSNKTASIDGTVAKED